MQRQWEANRWFLTADGEADKAWGNETVRAHPEAGWLELKLPPRWATLRTGPTAATGSCPATFHHRGDHWAAQAASGPVRYDISYHPERSRWHLDASWKTHHQTVTLAELCRRRALGVDLNADHLAAWVVDPDGNPIGRPHTIPLDLDGLPASTRDGRLREAISRLVDLATTHRCASVSIENLGFTEARQAGRETMGRGRRGRRFRRTVAVDPAPGSGIASSAWPTTVASPSSPSTPPTPPAGAPNTGGSPSGGDRTAQPRAPRPAAARCARPPPADGAGRATGPTGHDISGCEEPRHPTGCQARDPSP